MNHKPKVSIVMPSLNVAKYIRRTLESVTGQTLREIEIICVDAGSDDGTLDIIQEFAARDDRISIIHSDRKSYGYQMNLGFDAAKGEYLGIVETDDFADLDMFEKLYGQAIADDADVVKSGFYYYWSTPEERDIPNPIASEIISSMVLNPFRDFRAPMEMADFYNIKPTIWSAIYKAQFIRENDIRFNETPGASFQDASFNFKVFTMAQRVRMMQDCFLHYRQDNESSSINSPGKVYCVCDEYEEMERFLNAHPEKKGKMEGIRTRLQFDSYMWNFERLSDPKLQDEFIKRAAQEYKEEMYKGYIEPKYFPIYKWNTLTHIMKDPIQFAISKRSGNTQDFEGSDAGHVGKEKSSMAGLVQCVKDHGLAYTFKLGVKKIKKEA